MYTHLATHIFMHIIYHDGHNEEQAFSLLASKRRGLVVSALASSSGGPVVRSYLADRAFTPKIFVAFFSPSRRILNNTSNFLVPHDIIYCGLLNNTVNGSDYRASNDGMIIEY
jgi:hypothetical protein